MINPRNILVIQTAFIGDVVLATALAEDVHKHFSNAQITFLVRKGNESLFDVHPFVMNTLVWDKKNDKYRNLWRLIKEVRKQKFDCVLNLQRFAAAGMVAAFSGAKWIVGFQKNPLSPWFTHKVEHVIGVGHEIQRNAKLLAAISSESTGSLPKLYPTENQYRRIEEYTEQPFITMSPTSVWKTKAAPPIFWTKLIDAHPNHTVYLLGGPSDFEACQSILEQSRGNKVFNLCGKLSLMESAALMDSAQMNFTNDSAPMHLCSAMNAPVTAMYCSTVPAFGFGPLSDQARILETHQHLDCRPCGLHGHKDCPKGHFKCGDLDPNEVAIA